jgi:ABC-type multidrug transport system permease subunit
MYRRAAYPIANLLSDVPFSAVRIFIYNVIIYFMTGLHRSAGAFWTFELVSYMTFLSMQGFFRTFGLCFQNFDTAFRVSVIFVPNLIQYSGYLISEPLMKRWLFWIYYINPLSYSWAALMDNEFSRISLVCEGAFVVPRNGPGMNTYPNVVGPNQACTLYGASPGSNTVSGANYIKIGYGLDVNDLWRRNFLVVVGWFFFFILAQVFVIEYLQVFLIRIANDWAFSRDRLSMVWASRCSPRRRRKLPNLTRPCGRRRRSPGASKKRIERSRRCVPSPIARLSLGNASIIPCPCPVDLSDSSMKFMDTSSLVR